MYLKIILAFSVVFVAACEGPQPTWRKNGVAQDDMQSALAKCRYDVRMNKVSEAKENVLIQDCMQAKGFRWRAQ